MNRSPGLRFRRPALWLLFFAVWGYALGRLMPFEPLVPREAVYLTLRGPGPADALVALIDRARHSVDIAVYQLNDPRLIDAVERAYRRGVAVRLITDRAQAEDPFTAPAIERLLLLGIPVRVNDHAGLMHLKILVVDGLRAAVGSFNWTETAAYINEEVLMLIDDPAAVRTFSAALQAIWDDDVHYRTVLKNGG